MTSTTRVHARHVIPVRPAYQVLQDHALVIRSGRIIDLLPSAAARNRFPDATEVDLPAHVLLPGLINMHTHSPMTLFRGVADDREMQAWLRDIIWPLEARFVDGDFVELGTRLAVAEMVRGGTTCFNENYFFPDAIARVVDQTGLRACVGLPLIDMPSRWAGTVDEYFARGRQVADRYAESERLQFSLAPHAPYTVSDATLQRIAEWSASAGFPVHMHVLETAWERDQSLREYGLGPLERLHRHGLLNGRLIAVHMTQLLQSEIDSVAEQGVHVVHCPESNLKLAAGLCPLASLMKAGVNVSIGTDGAASNNDLDLIGEARTAALLSKGLTGDATTPDAFSMLEMMTINAACALGRTDDLGSLEVGKYADFAALNLECVRTWPVHDVVSTLLYAASSGQFSDVWVGGTPVMRQGCLTTLDEADVLQRAAVQGARIAQFRSAAKEETQ